jgi:hypothetical protein
MMSSLPRRPNNGSGSEASDFYPHPETEVGECSRGRRQVVLLHVRFGIGNMACFGCVSKLLAMAFGPDLTLFCTSP